MSRSTLARVAGILAVTLVLIGPFALMVVPGAVHLPGDPEGSLQALQGQRDLFAAGLAAEAGIVVIELFLTAILWALFRETSAWLAATAALARGVMSALQAVGLLVGVALLTGLPSLDPNLALAGLDLRVATILTWQIVFGVHCLVLGVLVWRSRLLPRVFGPLMAVAGLGYLQHTGIMLFAPQLSEQAGVVVALAAMLGEVPLFLWMLVMGTRKDGEAQAPSAPRTASASAAGRSHGSM